MKSTVGCWACICRRSRWRREYQEGASGKCKLEVPTCTFVCAHVYDFPTTRIMNEPGTGRGRTRRGRPFSAAGAVDGAVDGAWNKAVHRIMLPVLASKAQVRAPVLVWTFCSTAKSLGLFSFTTVSVASPLELN